MIPKRQSNNQEKESNQTSMKRKLTRQIKLNKPEVLGLRYYSFTRVDNQVDYRRRAMKTSLVQKKYDT